MAHNGPAKRMEQKCGKKDDSVLHEVPYGKLLIHMQLLMDRNICPSGWHVSI